MRKPRDQEKKKRLYFQLSSEEYQLLKGKAIQTTTPRISTYIRKVLFQGKITVLSRNRSMDDLMAELIRLRNELGIIANNYGQLPEILGDLQNHPDLKNWIFKYGEDLKILIPKIEEIKFQIAQFASTW